MARDHFSRYGYDRTTIRGIARDAEIDPSMVMRYYGNKEDLFTVAAEFRIGLPDFTGQPETEIGALLVTHFIRRWEADDTLLALLRRATTDTGAAERMQQTFAEQVAPVVIPLVRDRDDAMARAGLVASQILGMALCRYVLRFPPVVAMDAEEVIAWLGPTVQRYLTGDR